VDVIESYQRLDVIWEDGAAFLAYLNREGDTPSFFSRIPEDDWPEWAVLGETVSVLIQLTDRNTAFNVHMQEIEAIPEGDASGVRLAFRPDEKKRLELILATAEGDSVPYFRRRHKRVMCNLLVKVATGGFLKRKMWALDISEGGLYLVPQPLLKVDSLIRLTIDFPESTEAIAVDGRVISAVRDGPQQGVGVEFIFSSPKQRKALAGQIARLRDAQTA